jgi:HPt (histidine-containing phosphotransfer) domain-containing protein
LVNLGKHELRAACELIDIPFDEQTTEREMVERLIAKTGI